MASNKPKVKIGLLYSTTGTYRIPGEDTLNGALLAIGEINASAEYDFCFEPHMENPGGDLDQYKQGCERLIKEQGIEQIFGCITSSSRKEVIPVIEKHDAQLWYSVPYEGFECADNVFYTGACPNQHILPLFDYMLPRYGNRIYCVGSNYIWAWENSRIARDFVTNSGGRIIADRYVPMGSTDLDRILAEIAETEPDFVFCNLVGDSSYAFYEKFYNAGLSDKQRHPNIGPIVSCDLCERELTQIGYPAALGIYNQAIYFQSLDTPENHVFVDRYKQAFGNELAVSAMSCATYASIHLLAEAIKSSGSTDTETIREAVYALELNSPLGQISIDRDNNHAYLTPMLGRSIAGGQYETITCDANPLKPDPFLAWSELQTGLANNISQAKGNEAAYLRVIK